MIPPELHRRWSPMWDRAALPERPWWRALSALERESAPFAFVRADGETAQTEAECAAVDGADPLPEPPPVPGQVWVVGKMEVVVPRLGPIRRWPCVVDGIEVNPLKGAILVAGPSPWGRDVPWGPRA